MNVSHSKSMLKLMSVVIGIPFKYSTRYLITLHALITPFIILSVPATCLLFICVHKKKSRN